MHDEKDVFGSEETVERKQLDAWQGFAYDILERKAEEFERIAAGSGVRWRCARIGWRSDGRCCASGTFHIYTS